MPQVRLDTIAALESVFESPNVSGAGGAWELESEHSRGSSATGPGDNTPNGSYVTSDSGGSTIAAQTTENSRLEVKESRLSAWTGGGRVLGLRICIAGESWVDVGEGVEIQYDNEDGAGWRRLNLLRGWAYSSNGFVTGGTTTDYSGDEVAFSQDGGWIDLDIAIPDDAAKVRLHTLPVYLTGAAFRHDWALWSVDLRDGAPATQTVAAELQAGAASLSAAVTKSDSGAEPAGAELAAGPGSLSAAVTTSPLAASPLATSISLESPPDPGDVLQPPSGPTYVTSEGDMLDAVCRQHYGPRPGTVEAVLEANPGLADRGPLLPAGVRVELPELAGEPPGSDVVRLWD